MSEAVQPLESVEIAALSDFYDAAPDGIRRTLGITTEHVSDGLAAFVPASPALALNRILGLGICGPATEADVDRALGLFHRSGAERMFLQIHPGAASAGLTDLALEHGLTHYNNWYKLYHLLREVPPAETRLTIRKIGTNEARLFGPIPAAAFEWPAEAAEWIAATVGRKDWHHYMAFDSGEPVAAGAFFMSGREAWLDFAATIPSHRGLGAQSALLTVRLSDARRLGCRRAQVETAEPRPEFVAQSLRNVRKRGFHVAYKRANYILQSR
jgi:GNAT superfamily N-acetyltransferase